VDRFSSPPGEGGRPLHNLLEKRTMTTESNLNPQVKKIKIGKKELRDITIYPLSMTDQFKMTEVIQSALEAMEGITLTSDAQVITVIIETIKANLGEMLEYITDPAEEAVSFDEITNDQFYDIVDTVYKVNYEGAVKNFSDLFERVMSLLPSKRSVPTSVSDTDIDSSTATDSALEKED
jgi:hypothetical protein